MRLITTQSSAQEILANVKSDPLRSIETEAIIPLANGLSRLILETTPPVDLKPQFHENYFVVNLEGIDQTDIRQKIVSISQLVKAITSAKDVEVKILLDPTVVYFYPIDWFDEYYYFLEATERDLSAWWGYYYLTSDPLAWLYLDWQRPDKVYFNYQHHLLTKDIETEWKSDLINQLSSWRHQGYFSIKDELTEVVRLLCARFDINYYGSAHGYHFCQSNAANFGFQFLQRSLTQIRRGRLPIVMTSPELVDYVDSSTDTRGRISYALSRAYQEIMANLGKACLLSNLMISMEVDSIQHYQEVIERMQVYLAEVSEFRIITSASASIQANRIKILQDNFPEHYFYAYQNGSDYYLAIRGEESFPLTEFFDLASSVEEGNRSSLEGNRSNENDLDTTGFTHPDYSPDLLNYYYTPLPESAFTFTYRGKVIFTLKQAERSMIDILKELRSKPILSAWGYANWDLAEINASFFLPVDLLLKTTL